MMHEKYLPFAEQQLMSHFADVMKHGKCVNNKGHLNYYRESIKRYADYIAGNIDRSGKPLKEQRFPCQIEKDERLWIAACMMIVFHSENRVNELTSLFMDAYGTKPPIPIANWHKCFEGDLHLFFETNLPSPKSYKKWLKGNLTKRHFIPYIQYSAIGKENLEGPTNVDALLLNSKNGFATIIEAKVLSDISYEVTYDSMRNQIARSIDVMLEKNDNLCPPLDKREHEKTLFLMITPRLFKDKPETRLFGYKFNEYKEHPNSLARDLPHRKGTDWENISNRLGWLTWEDFKNVNRKCCPWLEQV